MTLRSGLLFFLSLVGSVHLQAQDPVVMMINGKNVLRSEFEYSFNKNNTGDIRSWKAISEYLPMFVEYKLKVAAAEDAGYDTLSTFRSEYANYRDQLIRPLIADQSYAEQKAREMYENIRADVEPDGMVRVAHILLRVGVNEKEPKRKAIQARADSIWKALQHGANFAVLAARYSQDTNSATNGGLLPWFGKRRTLKEFEDVAYAMTDGQLSRPFTSALGIHIVKKIGFKHLESFETLKPTLIQTVLKSDVAQQAADARISQAIAATGQTSEQVMQQFANELSANDISLRYLLQEYRDGLLLFEASNREVWQKASADERMLERFYKLNQSQYLWASPRYKGIVVHCTSKSVAKKVHSLLKKASEEKWTDIIRKKVNSDSETLCRIEQGLFKQGDNAAVDSLMFKVKGVDGTKYQTYPVVIFEGRRLEQPESYNDVRTLLVNDYQKVLENNWSDSLKKKYAVEVKQEALRTVNNH